MVIERSEIDSKSYTRNEKGERIEELGDIILNLEYWDCECPDNYIHPIAVKECKKCSGTKDEAPNSRENEIKRFGA